MIEQIGRIGELVREKEKGVHRNILKLCIRLLNNMFLGFNIDNGPVMLVKYMF